MKNNYSLLFPIVTFCRGFPNIAIIIFINGQGISVNMEPISSMTTL